MEHKLHTEERGDEADGVKRSATDRKGRSGEEGLVDVIVKGEDRSSEVQGSVENV